MKWTTPALIVVVPLIGIGYGMSMATLLEKMEQYSIIQSGGFTYEGERYTIQKVEE